MRPMTPFLLAGLLGCRQLPDKADPDTGSADTAAPSFEAAEPWLDWEAVALSGLHPLLEVPLPDAVQPASIETVPDRSLSFVWDPAAAKVWVLDSRYRHDPSITCVSAAAWPDWGDALRRRGCPEGQVHTQRGALSLPQPATAAAVDPDGMRVALLGADGALWLADADMLSGNPLDHLRPLETGLVVSADWIGFTDDGDLLAASGATLQQLDLDTGSVRDTQTLPGTVRDAFSFAGVTWARTDSGLYRDGVLVLDSEGVSDVAWGGDTVYFSDATDGAVFTLGPDGLGKLNHHFDALSGPIAASLDGAVAYVVTPDGIRSTGGGSYDGDFVDVAVNAAHEVVALRADGGVTVLGDEDRLSAPAEPVALMIAAFIEKPRSTDADATCRGDSSVQAFATQAGENAWPLAELPAAVALGLTPHFARRAVECDEAARVAPLLGLERLAVGALFHEQHGCTASDTGCIADFLADEASAITALGAEVSFSSGLSTQEGDWVAALEAAGAPSRYVFFGASVLDDIPAEGDPRAKDAWPLTDRAPLWRASSPAGIAQQGGSGWLVMQPGDNLPAFNLSACANLFLRECHVSGAGDGVVLDEEDAAVLAVLARRAIAEQGDGPAAWSFHLPDLGVYDYTEGCTRSDGGLWSGEACGAARLQEWAEVMHTRYVLNGLARWATPAAVEAP